MSNFVRVTPFLHVDDVGRAVAFFTDTLRFEALVRARDYACVHRETVGFRILEQSHDDGPPKLDTLPAGDVYGPANQGYGQRELLVLAPDGNLIAFGQTVSGGANAIHRPSRETS